MFVNMRSVESLKSLAPNLAVFQEMNMMLVQ